MAEKGTNNLKHVSEALYNVIIDLIINKPWIAKRVYRDLWKEGKEENSKNILEESKDENNKKLIIRLRNKLDGYGSITLKEIVDIEDALLEFSDILRQKVLESKAERKTRFKKKIDSVLEHFDEEEKRDLLS